MISLRAEMISLRAEMISAQKVSYLSMVKKANKRLTDSFLTAADLRPKHRYNQIKGVIGQQGISPPKV